MTLSEFADTYYLREGHIEDMKIKDGGGTLVLRLGISFWMQDWYDPSSMPQKGSVRAVFKGVRDFEYDESFDFRRAGISEVSLREGALSIGLWDESRMSCGSLRLFAESAEVSGPLLNRVGNPPSKEDLKGKDAYLRFVLEYGTRPLWVVDAETNLMLNRTFPPGWETDMGLLVTFKEIREGWMALFEDSLYEFSYKGFRSEEERSSFISKVERMKAVVAQKNNGEYFIQDDMDLSAL